jgi:hypothetical protein
MRTFLLLAIPLVLSGQPFSERYAPLIRALSLTDAQIAELAKPLPEPARSVPMGNRVGMYPGRRTPGPPPPPPERIAVLDDAQRAKLAEIEKAYDDLHLRAGAIVMGLIDKAKWGGSFLCYDPVFTYRAELGLTDEQVQGITFNPSQAGAVLTDAQKAKVAAFEANLELGCEAIEVHVMTQPMWGEVLCH